ncbi:MAG: YggS family pyridoxal phosphate-dependent enzyme [Pseudomonadota bacterium]
MSSNEAINGSVNPAENLAKIKEKISEALKEAGKPDRSVEIVAVSKKHSVQTIEPALRAGHRIFGENRVQEAMAKWPELRARFSDITLHLIGPLQSNKASDAVAFFDVIETIDRRKIAKAIANEIDRQGKQPRLLVQVNIGEEPQKSGIPPKETDAFIKSCRDEFNLPIEGLMCIPPASDPPAPYFALLKKLCDDNGLNMVSMGMTQDYVIGAQLGATHLRIGSGVFGPRPT